MPACYVPLDALIVSFLFFILYMLEFAAKNKANVYNSSKVPTRDPNNYPQET